MRNLNSCIFRFKQQWQIIHHVILRFIQKNIYQMIQVEKSKYQINQKYEYQECCESKAGIWSRLFFAWTYNLIKKGNSKTLEMNDLSDLHQLQEPSYSADRFCELYQNQRSISKKPLQKALNLHLGWSPWITRILVTIGNLLQFSGPLILKEILQIFQSKQPSIKNGFILVSILIITLTLRTIIYQHGLHLANLNYLQSINAINSIIYQKVLKLRSVSKISIGSIMNYLNVDGDSVWAYNMLGLNFYWAPLMILIGVGLLVREVGWIGCVAPAIFLLGFPLQQFIMKKGFSVRKNQMKWADERSKFISQYFSAIKIVKYHGWQDMVKNKIKEIRKKELSLIFKSLLIRSYIEALMTLLPLASSIIIFSFFVHFEGEQLNLTKIYTVLSVFNLIGTPMRDLVSSFISFLNVKVSFKRIQDFLVSYQGKQYTEFDEIREGCIQINQGVFSWQREINKKQQIAVMQKEKLGSDIHQSLLSSDNSFQQQKHFFSLKIPKLSIKKGEFISIIGKVGSGKSTLLESIMSELNILSGKLKIKGRIAYVPQIAWLRSTTIRQNIIFQQPFQREKYQKILSICQLNEDLKVLGGGDLTEIGEKGLNLSGGQKQRISIARALYYNAEIYLLDDCLSALDSFVGENVFKKAIQQYLQEQQKTVILVTNSLNYASRSQRILVMENGKIIEDGSPNELKTSGIFYQQMLTEYHQKQSKTQEAIEKDIGDSELYVLQDKKEKVQGLVKIEERLRGSVSWLFYYRFFTVSGWPLTCLALLFIFLSQIIRVGSDWFLGEWSQDAFSYTQTTYIWIYGLISLFVLLSLVIKGFFFANFIKKTSKIVQEQLIDILLTSPLSWFDVTPTGRILTRTTRDQDDLDTNLSFNIQSSIQNLLVLLSSIILVSIASPFYLIVVGLSGLVYFRVVLIYLRSSREIKRLLSNSRALLNTHFQETCSGVTLIRAHHQEEAFRSYFLRYQKMVIVTISNQNITNRWIKLITDLFSVILIGSAGYLSVFVVAENPQSVSLIGLALVWSLQVSTIMPDTLRILAETENNMNAVVRLFQYVDNNPQERSFSEPSPIDAHWPKEGTIKIQNVSYRYREGLPLVIRNLSLSIEGNEKIGIVGRTGSGKSTFILGLLRILEIADNSDESRGQIFLDGEDISEIGLHYLRHCVSVIPQDPVLFTGTIRFNIDPFQSYSDEKILESLRKVRLFKQLQQKNLDILSIDVEEGGKNLSVGQRQLLCVARALIREPKVLLMDEATASIDEKTDEAIQLMIKTQFSNTTVITIAHRLRTVLNSDKILVLSQGLAIEYGTPSELLDNPSGFLRKAKNIIH